MNTNLRNNKDGTCNCTPLGKGCFFENCYCSCHTLSKEPVGEGWEKELEDLIADLSHEIAYGERPKFVDKTIKDFIRSTLASAVKEERQRIVEVLESMKVNTADAYAPAWSVADTNWNKALSDAITKLNKPN